MNEYFERHRDRLTDAERRQVWSAMQEEIEARRKRRHGVRFWLPTTVTAGAVAVVAVTLLGPDVLQRGAGRHMIPEEQAELRGADPRDEHAGESELWTESAGDAAATPTPGALDEAVTAGRVPANDRDEAAAARPEPSAKQEANEFRQSDLTPETKPLSRDLAGNVAEPGPATAAGDAPRSMKVLQEGTAGRDIRMRAGLLRGRVLAADGSPVAFASVLVLGTDRAGTTGADGYFAIPDVPRGEVRLRVIALGYAHRDVAFILGEEDALLAEVTLTEGDWGVLFGSLIDGNEIGAVGKIDNSNLRTQSVDELQGRTNTDGRAGAREGRPSGEGPADGAFDSLVGDAVVGKGESDQSQEKTWGRIERDDARLPARSSVEAEARRQSVYRPQVEYAPESAPSTRPGSRYPISVGGTDPVNGQPHDSMFFEHYGVNPFVDPTDDRFATFAVDVDNASFTLSRRYLMGGDLPPKEAVRVEEFINSFDHRYPAPGGALTASRRPVPSTHGTFAIYLDAAPSPFGAGKQLLRVGLKGREIDSAHRKPAVLTFLVDVSGSMAREDRLGLVKQALGILLDQMRPSDSVGLVVYGSNARVILPHTGLDQRWSIEQAIASLRPEGATNAEAGLLEAYRLADRSLTPGCINRVILCSDGVANVGNTGAEDILERIKREARRGIELTAVGFGMGNYNDVLMEKLANQGDGNYYYVDELKQARKVFAENLTGTLQTIAKDTKIQVEFDPGIVKRYRLIGYENRDVADEDFRNDRVDAGEVGAGHEVTALFEVELREKLPGRKPVATVRIRYEDPETGRVTEEEQRLAVRNLLETWNEADATFRMDAAVAEFAEILRQSYWAKDASLGHALGLAHTAAWQMHNPNDVRDIVEAMERAAALWPEDQEPTGWRDDPRFEDNE